MARFLSRDLVDITRRLAWMAEYRDGTVLSHLDRIRGYSFVLASNAGLPAQEAELISYACQLHDIGKTGLPDSVLFNSGNLSDYEWELVRRHPLIGAELLKGSPILVMQTGEIVALTHHERWNGSGYPQGLKKDAIPLSGRICALVDVYDALITRRPYKEPIPPLEAMRLIRESSGQLFDPQLVDVFVRYFDDILKFKV